MDIFDRATEAEERMREAALQEAKHKAEKYSRTLQYLGYCHYCYEPTEHNKRFCDRFCRDDWEKEQQLA